MAWDDYEYDGEFDSNCFLNNCFVMKYMLMMFFYFLKIIFDINTLKRSKTYKLY